MIKMTEYAKRRNAFMQQIGANNIAIIPSAPECLRNGDAFYVYRQNSDFYYLTGFEEPEAVLVLAPHREEGEYILFNRVRDPAKETWDGPRAGQKGACEHFLADQAFAISEFTEMLPDLLAGRTVVHCPLGLNRQFDKTLMRALNTVKANIRKGIAAPISFTDSAAILHEMRLFKSPAEKEVMQKAADITAKAHVHAMSVCKPGMYEYQLEAELLYQFQHQGARSAAYTSIVGAGRNACIIHYINNDKRMADGDLVLVDAGAEYQLYASDVTRTFPVNGRFTGEQRAIYEIVLAAQKAAINHVKPGQIMVGNQEIVTKILTQGLLDEGLLKGNLDDLIEKKAYFPFYPHRPGHWLGLDVHDAGAYQVKGQWRPLEPGMVLTVEPGLYIPADIPNVPERFHNIGVRIEDNVFVTEKGCDILTQAIPKEIADIEAIMAK